MFKNLFYLGLLNLCFNNVIGSQTLKLDVYDNNITCLQDINGTHFKFNYDLDCGKNCIEDLVKSQYFINSKFNYNNKTIYLKDLVINSINNKCLSYGNLNYSYNLKFTKDHLNYFISILFSLLLLSIITLIIVLMYKASKKAPIKNFIRRRRFKYNTFEEVNSTV